MPDELVGILHVEGDEVRHHDSLILGVISHPHWLDFDGELDLKHCVELCPVLKIEPREARAPELARYLSVRVEDPFGGSRDEGRGDLLARVGP